ncbi:MAG: hypothetical protein GY727_14710, partial [Gammaproteobacteria bacterium]|nr:hypothetical protein [Gammaproteobacteria bacterium]
MTLFQATDDHGGSIEIEYFQRQRGYIGLSQQFQSGVVSVDLLSAYVQRGNEHDYANFKEHEIDLDGFAGYEFIGYVFHPSRAESDCRMFECSLYSASAEIKRYILLNLPNADPVLIEVSLSADTYHEAYDAKAGRRGTAADWVKQLGAKWDRQVAADIKTLGAEADQILNGLRFIPEGEGVKNSKSEDRVPERSKKKGTAWELIDTSTSLQGKNFGSDELAQVDETYQESQGMLGNTALSCYARATSEWSWTAPSQFLYVGETKAFGLSVGVGEDPNSGLGNDPSSLELWLDDDSIDVFTDGSKLGSTNIVTNVQIDVNRGRWKVPGGNPGDQLALTFAVKGPADCEGGTVVYLYKLKSYTKTPKVNETNIDKTDNDEIITDEADIEDILDQLTGIGDVGPIPGPENIKQALAGVVAPAILIAILSALGQLGGSTPQTGMNGGTPVPPNKSQSMTLTDALGRNHEYEWSPEDGGYINPETGGMLDSSLWKEYNSGLAVNQAFNERQREKLARRDTDFDRQVDKLLDSQKQRQVLVHELEDLKKAGYRLGPDGARASGHADKLLEKARTGQPVSLKQVAAVKRFIRDRQSGRTEVESDRQTVSELDVFKEGVQGTVRTAITAKNPDGTISWPAMATRIAIAIKTGGASEYVMIPAESGYVVKDCMDQGASVGEAVATAGGIAVVSAVAGKMIAGGLGVVAKGAGWVARGAAKGAGKYLPGTTAAAKKAAKWFGKGVTGLGKEFKQVGQLVKEGTRAAAKKIGLGGTRAVARQSTRSTLTLTQKKLQQAFTKAVAEGDDQALMGLYKNGGMKKLAALEKAGQMSPTQVKAANTIMSRNMKQAIKEGTETSIESFERKTGIKIKEVLLGDSGSSAKGTARSILTDYDRTIIASFDDDAIAAYAKKNGISINNAKQNLTKEFMDTHAQEVGHSVQRNLGINAINDVDYAAYNGIGAGAGPADSYPLGFTNARQSVIGTGTRTYRAPNGQIRTVTVSGDTIVDANALKSAKITGKLAPDPTRIGAKEMPGLLKQQVQSAAGHNDGKSLAKALGRANYVAKRARLKTDTGLSRIAQQIFDNPQKMKTILQQNGVSEAQFVKQARQLINNQ